MPVIRGLKTYGRTRKCNLKDNTKQFSPFPVSEASLVFDALLAKNVEKRNSSTKKPTRVNTRAKKKQNAAPKAATPANLFDDDSIQVRVNNTFDNLLQGPHYNSVKFCNASSLYANTSSENSITNKDHSSPYNTRKKSRKNYAKLNKNDTVSKFNKSNVKTRGKVKKKKDNNAKKLVKQAKLVINATSPSNINNNIKSTHSYLNKSVNYSLIIDNGKDSDKKYCNTNLNTSNSSCAKKFTSIASTSNVLPSVNKANDESGYDHIFQTGFRHCMRAESTPKYLLSSTPIYSKNQKRNTEKLEGVSPIAAKSRLNLNHLMSLYESNIDNPSSFKLLTENSLPGNCDLSNSKKIISLRSSMPKDIVVQEIVTKDDSHINYSSLIKQNTDSRRKLSRNSKQRICKSINIADDTKLNAMPVVVLEKNLDMLGISGKVSLICPFSSFSTSQTSHKNNRTDSNIIDDTFKRKYSPKIILEKLSLSRLKNQMKNVNTRTRGSANHSISFETHEENVSRMRVRSKSESHITCDKICCISDDEINNADNEVEIIQDDNVVENSNNESLINPLKYITTRKKKVRINVSPDKNLQSAESTKKRYNISLHEWERFSQSTINLVKIDDPEGHTDNVKISLEKAKEISCNKNEKCDENDSPIKTRLRHRKSNESDQEIVKDGSYNADRKQSIFLKPGKQWFRSLSLLRNTNIHNLNLSEKSGKGRKWRESVYEIFDQQARKNSVLSTCLTQHNEICNPNGKIQSRTRSISRRTSLKIVQLSTLQEPSIIPNETNLEASSCSRNKSGYISAFANESILESFDKLSLTADVGDREETARQIILKRCGQTTPILFNDCYSQRTLKKCRKIGEGVYGEVFMYKSLDNKCRVMKVIPIEGELVVNGEHQKKFEEIISEIIIASELSNLRINNLFNTNGFAELIKICCVQGKYPQQLLDLWDLYDEDHGSENDSPEVFPDDQLYIVLELANGGQDMEAYRFNNAEQSYAVFVQVVCSLAVAESAMEFEHRDMHWGNILISPTDEATTTFRLNGREFEVATRGVQVSIIDFTLSRMTYNNCCIFNDLSLDPDLFTATGDYQFEIYRLMKKRNQDDWQRFEPYSNILWLDYTLEKMINHLRYLRVTTKTHKTYIRRLSQLRKKILTFSSATELLNSDVFSHVFL